MVENTVTRTLREPGLASERQRLSFWIRPMLWAHRLLSRNGAERQAWDARIEKIRHMEAIDRAPSPEAKALLQNVEAFREVRAVGALATAGMSGVAALWMARIIEVYGPTGWNIGWLALSAFFVPIPIAWRLGRRMWERSTLASMLEMGETPEAKDQLRALSASVVRGMAIGATLGFGLVFTQLLMTWFITPQPTFLLELYRDVKDATQGSAVGAMAGAVLGPLTARFAPRGLASGAPRAGLPAEARIPPALPSPGKRLSD